MSFYSGFKVWRPFHQNGAKWLNAGRETKSECPKRPNYYEAIHFNGPPSLLTALLVLDNILLRFALLKKKIHLTK